MKKTFIVLLAILHLSFATKAQSYDDGVAAGVRDAEELKAQVRISYNIGGWTLVRHKVDPEQFGGIGAEIGETEPCNNGVWGCVFVVEHNESPASANIILYNDDLVVFRREYLWSRRNESVYWAGIYDGFMMRWFFVDFE